MLGFYYRKLLFDFVDSFLSLKMFVSFNILNEKCLVVRRFGSSKFLLLFFGIGLYLNVFVVMVRDKIIVKR